MWPVTLLRRVVTPRVSLLLAALGAVCSALAIAGGASAEPRWLPPRQLTPADGGPGAAFARVAVDPTGDAVVAWERGLLVQAVSRLAGSDTWSAPVDVSPGWSPTVALDAAGNAVVGFGKGDFVSGVAQAAYRAGPSGSWQAPVTLSPAAGAGTPEIAVNPAGDAVAVWSRSVGVVEASFRPASTGVWQRAVDLAQPAGRPAVAVDETGDAVAVWAGGEQAPAAGNVLVRASVRAAPAGAWEPAVAVAGPFGDVTSLQVASDGAGDAVAAWIGIGPTGEGLGAHAAYRPAGGSWGPTTVVSAPTGGVDDLRVGIGPAGDALAVWRIERGGSWLIQAASRPAASSAWQAPVDLFAPSREHVATGVDLAVDRDGNAVAAWTELEGNVRASLRPAAAGTWQPPVDLATPAGGGDAVDVAMDGRGNALAVWGRFGAPNVVEAAELRATGPVLTNVTVPSSATARVPIRFSVQAVPWGAPLAGPPRWSFGDGASATGATVEHVYAAAGTYAVSVGQADAAGGTSTASATIAVVAPTLANTARPTIRGTPRVGRALTCLPGSWEGTSPIRYAYVWLRAGRRVAAGYRHRLSRRDAGALVACRVRATNPAGSAEATSKAVRVRPRL